ncbi:MAG: hypothetical protein Q8N21_02455 [bacterium]|nr:hypothetical protein [bacterium]
MIIVSISCAGCAPGLVSGLAQDIGLNIIKEGLKAAGRNKPIFNKEKEQEQPSDKAKKNFVKPDRVVKIDKESEVYMYYDYKEGKVDLRAFIGEQVLNSGYSELDYKTKSDYQLKKEFINTFPCYAHLRGTPSYTPRPGDTYETVIAEFGDPNDRIPLYYEEGIVVSEMLIYYESPKKFLAVGIARGKVVRTQEFALKEGQGMKDALASAGITPATMPEPTPAPAPRTSIPLRSIPTTGLVP